MSDCKVVIYRNLKIILCIFGIICLAYLLLCMCRIFVCEQYIIPTHSMTPTLIPGDRIWVNKLIFGGRIYKEFDFNMDAPLKSWRMPRLRVIQPNDVLVFNAPHGYDRGKIEFKINYVYAKRCIGTPGDTISIQNCRFYNNNWSCYRFVCRCFYSKTF